MNAGMKQVAVVGGLMALSAAGGWMAGRAFPEDGGKVASAVVPEEGWARRAERGAAEVMAPQGGGEDLRPVLTGGRDGIREALAGAPDTRARAERVREFFREACHIVSANGDFSPLRDLFAGMTQDERSANIGEVADVFSKLGPAHDLKEKLALVDGMPLSADMAKYYRNRMLQLEARERIDEMKREGVVDTLTPEEFTGVCVKLAQGGISKGFKVVPASGDEAARRRAAAEVARFAMRAGAMEGGEEIRKLPPGIIRDEAVASLVIWLKETGSEQEAGPWMETIQDGTAKARAEKFRVAR